MAPGVNSVIPGCSNQVIVSEFRGKVAPTFPNGVKTAHVCQKSIFHVCRARKRDHLSNSSRKLHPAATSSTSEPPSVEEKVKEKFNWLDQWYAVSLIQDLDSSRPTAFQLLGIELVLWKDENGKWQAFKDLCPHRLAPLSEGRIDSKGHLQCPYHGWSFQGDGKCKVIPQADPQGPESKAMDSSRACASAFPTVESQGLLFVWPNPQTRDKAEANPPPRLPAVFEDSRYGTVTIQRDLLYGYDVLMENVVDPSHIHFAHHKVTGRRDRASPIPFQLASSGGDGFSGSSEGPFPRFLTQFSAPTLVVNKIELRVPLPLVGTQEWEIWICSFNVPMAPGKTRSIVCSARNFSQWSAPESSPLPLGLRLVPRWLEHLTSNQVYDGDMTVLQGQERALRRGAGQGGTGSTRADAYSRLTFTPTRADRLVLAFRSWMRREGGGAPAWAPGVAAGEDQMAAEPLNRRQMLDRLSQHTEICSSCRGALAGVRLWVKGLSAAAVVAVAMAALPSEFSSRLLLAAVGLAMAAAAAFLKFSLEPQFVFVDYVHADIED